MASILNSGGVLRVSAQAQGVLEYVASTLHVGVADAARVAFALAVRSLDAVAPLDDCGGLALGREELFGEWDGLFKALVMSREGRFIGDLEYFPGVAKRYVDAGARMLGNERKYASGDFWVHLAELEKGV